MSQLPQVRRLLVEDFMEQKDWISKLFTPLNTLMDGIITSLTKGITLRENCAADIITVKLDRVPTDTDSIGLPWTISQSPISLHVGNITRVDGGNILLTAAVGVQWRFFGAKGLQLTNIVGIVPSTTDKYYLTLVAFTG